MQEITSDIITLRGNQPGPTVAVFAGVHGNETAGVYALQETIPTLKLKRGSVVFVFANPPAIKDNVRMHAKNLNRLFIEGIEGDSYEVKRARELMAILDNCDALLDLHMFQDPAGKPFAICEENSFAIAKTFDVEIISNNWTAVEPGGSEGYMYTKGKFGICVECGPIEKAAEYKDFAVTTIYQFLQYFDILQANVAISTRPKRIITAIRGFVKDTDELKLADGLHNFDRLEAGRVIATDGERTFQANEGECIIFPRYYATVGQELYIIGTESTESL